MSAQKCKICGSNAIEEPRTRDGVTINCTNCGRYFVAGSLFIEDYHDKSNFYKLSSWIREQHDEFNVNVPEFSTHNFDEILNIRDKRIQEKFDLMMVYLSKLKMYEDLSKKIFTKCWIRDGNEFDQLFKKSLSIGYIEGEENKTIAGDYSFPFFKNITFDGLEYVENLDNPNQSSKNIFVAFNFEDALNEVFNIHLNKAITENGFNYTVVNQDNVEHNKSINDEIIVKLKSSKIVIADFTNHRNSVYFEAGFAMGMNIPIIWTCQKGHDKEMSFDTRQFPHILWENKDDLVKQVIDRIKVIL
jgi:nucleoside 2-deoxyribosyltransferase